MKQVRMWLVGCGTVGQWLLRALAAHTEHLASRYDFVPVVVRLATARDGLIYNPNGLDLATLVALIAGGRPPAEHPGPRC
jgi:homoserine dehydrogenase